MKQNLRGPSLISAFPHYGVPLDWGSSKTSEIAVWVQKTLGMQMAARVGHTMEAGIDS